MRSILSHHPWLKQLSEADLLTIEENIKKFELTPEKVRDWFGNFGTEEEYKLALKIFNLMDYHSNKNIVETIKIYKTQIDQSMQTLNSKNLVLISSDENTDSSTSFIYDLGKNWKVHESSTFRKSELPKEIMEDKNNYFVFFNDTHGTGNQFVGEFKTLIDTIGQTKCAIISITMTDIAINRFKTEFPNIALIQPSFQSTKNIEKHQDETTLNSQDIRLLNELGKKVYSKGILGYKDTGLLVAYAYQCPNNTLPIIWANGDNNEVDGQSYTWNPLFEYKKIKEEKNNKPPKDLSFINTSKEENASNTKFIKPFNVPFEGKREGAIGIEEKLKEVHESLSTTRKTSIGQARSFQGIGGLGKTQLAVEYAHKYRDSYDSVVWLTIDQDINEQLIELAEKSKWVNKEVDINVKLLKAEEGYATLENTLLIYDNVENIEDIESLFPQSSTNKILLTSRNPISKFKSIPLDILNEENSIKLLESESGRQIKDNESNDAKQLVLKLEGLPLALEMAGAYVSFLECSWGKYWELFSKNGIALLNKSNIDSNTGHIANIHNTLSLGDKFLKQNPKLEDILNILAWGAFDAIDENLISIMLGEDSVDLIESISIGLKLKFLKKSEDGYTLHRLVRDTWKEQKILDNNFAISVSKRLASYMEEIKDEFLYLRELDRAATQARQWVLLIEDLHIKSALINYSVYANYHKGENDNALQDINNILKLFDENECSAIYAELLNSKGVFLFHTGKDNEKAHKLFLKSCQIKQVIYGDVDHKDIAQTLHNLALTYMHLGDNIECKKSIAKSLEMRRRLYVGKNHYKITESLNSFSYIEREIGTVNKAKIHATESLKMIKALYLNIDHPGIAYALDALIAVLYKANTDMKMAEGYAIESLKMRKRLYSNTNHPDIQIAFNTLGLIYNRLKKWKESHNYYMKSLKMSQITTPDNHVEIAISLRNLADNFLAMKDCKSAKNYIEKAIERLERLDYEYRDMSLYINTLEKINKNIKNYTNANYRKKGKYCIDI